MWTQIRFIPWQIHFYPPMRLLTRKNIRGCMTFLESFMSVPCFRNTCRHKHHSIDRCQQILYSSYKFFFSRLCVFNYVTAYFLLFCPSFSFFLISHFFLLYLLKEKIFSTSVFCLLLNEFTPAWTCCSHGFGLTGQMLWLTLPGWTISWCPVRLYWMCISFWKLSCKNKTKTGDIREVRRFSRKCNLELLHCGIRSYPLFHDVVSVVRHFFYDAEGSCVDRTRLNDHFSSLCHTTHNHWTLSLSDLGCLCSPQSLLEGSSNNLKISLVG